MITYRNALNIGVCVYLDGKKVGNIEPEYAGNSFAFRYWPNGVKSMDGAGLAYPTIAAVKRSIESDS